MGSLVEEPTAAADAPFASSSAQRLYPMELPEYSRYGRQMILPDFGIDAQLRLRCSRVLVIGAGGLGCPAIQYLAAAGVGHITVVDHDKVERSNLARQILHNEDRLGMPKAESCVLACRSINPHVRVDAVVAPFSSDNASALTASHDLVLDCTDNPSTRYLISDAAIVADKMVVSAAAQGYEGQIAVWNRFLDPREPCVPEARVKEMKGGESTQTAGRKTRISNTESVTTLRKKRLTSERGPCYRCIFPVSPKPSEVVDCSEGGVLGTITGLVGTMQALEAIRLIARIGDEFSPAGLQIAAEHRQERDEDPRRVQPAGIMTLIAPVTSPLQPFRSVKLRPRRQATCRSCGDPEIMADASGLIDDVATVDYATFCGHHAPSVASDGDIDRLDVGCLMQSRADGNDANGSQSATLTVDVRPAVEYGIASITPSLNVPIVDIRRSPSSALARIKEFAQQRSHNGQPRQQGAKVQLLCRRGNDSLEAARLLQAAEEEEHDHDKQGSTSKLRFVDVRGGLQAYSRDVDAGFPVY